jgi:dienelactone hydrolase
MEIEKTRPVHSPGKSTMNGRTPKQNGDRATFWVLVSLALILVGDIGAYLVQTDGGNIKVLGFKLPTQNGQWVAADLFRPERASAENPVPLVVVCPGFERSKETMTSYSIELARRGIAVITIDPYGQGASSSTQQRRSASVEGYGVMPMVEYVCGTSNLNYIDKSRVGAAGYSAGGNAVLQSASRLGARQAKLLRRAKAAGSHDGKTVADAELAQARAENKISSIFVGGYVLTLTDAVLQTVEANVGVDYACYDEGAFRTEKGNAHLQDAPEALRLVNAILPADQQLSEVTIGKIYGDPADQTLRVVHNTRCIHPLMPYDPTHIANLIEFFTAVFDLKPPIASSNQIWPLKELFTLMALAGGFLFLVPFTALLLQLPVFRSLVQPVPPPLPAPRRNGRILFWSLFAFSACLACFLFIPMAQATAVVFPDASASKQTWWFPQRINNAILLWAVANGLIGLAVFFLNYQFQGKKCGVTPAMWGLKTNLKELTKTFLLALIVFVAFYGLLFVSYGIFHTDFRFTFVSAAASFPPKMLLVALEYIPPFFIFYLANSIRVNGGNRFEGQKEWVGMLIGGLGNSVGLMMILAIQYSHLVATGTVYWTQDWLYANLLFGVTPLMFILPYFNRYFFRLTGKVYLGPMITCLIFIMMMLTGNVCYIPLK